MNPRNLFINENYKSAISQVLERCLSLNHESIESDIKHVSRGGTLGSMMHGFNKLLGSTSPHPSQYNTLCIYMEGGITFNEIREIKNIGAQYGVRIIVAATHVSIAKDVIDQLYNEK